MLRHGSDKPLARLGRIDQCIEESLPIPLGKHERFMFGDRSPSGAGEGADAEIGQLPPLEMRCTLDKVLSFRVEPEPKPLGADGRVTEGFGLLAGHGCISN